MTGGRRHASGGGGGGEGGEAGLTLVEVLVAIVILGVGVMSMLSVFFAAGRFSSNAARDNDACRIIEAVLDYSMEFPDWAVVAQESSVLSPIVTPMGGLVWRLDATQDPSSGTDESLANVWLLKLRVAADSNDNGTFEDTDWEKAPVRPRGFVKYGNLQDASCETFLHKK